MSSSPSKRSRRRWAQEGARNDLQCIVQKQAEIRAVRLEQRQNENVEEEQVVNIDTVSEHGEDFIPNYATEMEIDDDIEVRSEKEDSSSSDSGETASQSANEDSENSETLELSVDEDYDDAAKAGEIRSSESSNEDSGAEESELSSDAVEVEDQYEDATAILESAESADDDRVDQSSSGNAEGPLVKFPTKPTSKEILRLWALECNVPALTLTKLLHSFPQMDLEDIPNFPLDARTLLRTERHSKGIRFVCNGKYLHIGLLRSIEHKLRLGLTDKCVTKIDLHFNIDGIPIAKNPKREFWPILGQIGNAVDSSVFTIGVFEGTGHPEPVNDYLLEFKMELADLIANGLQAHGKQYTIDASEALFICDALGKAHVKGTRYPTGYYGCDRCTVKGKWHGRVTFLRLNAPLRTMQSFLAGLQKRHHREKTILSELPIDMIKQFINESMHSVDLGVVRRLKLYWTTPKKVPFKLNVNAVSIILVALRSFIPSEYHRKGQRLDASYKAIDGHLLLCYTGPVALKKLPKNYYEHFLILHCAIRILSDPVRAKHTESLNAAAKLLRIFVRRSMTLYGRPFVVYNVHSLIHLTADVRNYGHLSKFHAYPFESHLGWIKNQLLRSKHLPLEQISRRLSERNHLTPAYLLQPKDYPQLIRPHRGGPTAGVPVVKTQYKKMVTKRFTIAIADGDNCFYLFNRNVAKIVNILQVGQKDFRFVVNYSGVKSDFFKTPMLSSDLDIYKFDDFSENLHVISERDIAFKMVLFPILELNEVDHYVCFPLLHTVNN